MRRIGTACRFASALATILSVVPLSMSAVRAQVVTCALVRGPIAASSVGPRWFNNRYTVVLSKGADSTDKFAINFRVAQSTDGSRISTGGKHHNARITGTIGTNTIDFDADVEFQPCVDSMGTAIFQPRLMFDAQMSYLDVQLTFAYDPLCFVRGLRITATPAPTRAPTSVTKSYLQGFSGCADG